MAISNLTYTDTFLTWFDTTNQIITNINGITVYNIIAGDGISATSSGNVFTIKHGNNVTTGVTFGGSVVFNGSVSFNAGSPTISSTTISVSPKISGITAGNVVRFDGLNGLTKAKADSAQNAEVLGIVVGESASSTTVGIAGTVGTSFFSNIFANALGYAGATLKPGTAYFLDPVVAGGITTIEPNTYGQVTKPILLGVTFGSGMVLTYRGIQLEGITAGITAELDNKIIIQVDYSGSPSGDFTGNPVKIGDPIIYWTDDGAADIPKGKIKVYGKLNNSTSNNIFIPDFSQYTNATYLTSPYFLGLISNIISNSGSVYVLEITLPGGSFNATISNLDSNYFNDTTATSPLYINTSAKLVQTDGTNKFVDFIKTSSTTAKIILTGSGSGSSVAVRSGYIGSSALSLSGTTAVVEYDNLIPNGSFAVWQRGITGLTASGLKTYSTPFADRWFVITNQPTGLTANLSRQEFVSNQTEVPGSPLYYINAQFQCGFTALDNRPRIENIQREARLLQDEQITVSFWAKSTTSGSTLDIIYNQYKDSYSTSADVKTALSSRVSAASGITLSTSWNEYVYTFSPAVAGFTLSASEKGWLGLGFEFPSSSATISLAQVQVETGDAVSSPVYVSPENELNRCSPYYLRTYDVDQANGYSGTSRLNEQVLQLGNLLTQRYYPVTFPVKMVQTPDSTKCYIYSSYSGQTGDAYNVNTSKDMRYSGTGTVSLPWDTVTARTSSAWPSPNISISSISKYGMNMYVANGATHLDTLKFHYVIDADLDINV